MPSWPSPLPAWFWPWARWRDQGGHPASRPAEAPEHIPAWAWDRYRLHRGPAAARPSAPSSVFAGRGLFTVERRDEAMAAGLRVDWFASALDAFAWLRLPSPPTGAIVQVENAEQLARVADSVAALRAQYPDNGYEFAIVTNLDRSLFPGGWPDGFTCMPECYWNADGGRTGVGRSVPRMMYEARQVIGAKWGRVPVVPVVGCYDASGERPGVGVRLELPDYLPDLAGAMVDRAVVGYAVWRWETLGGGDLEALRR